MEAHVHISQMCKESGLAPYRWLTWTYWQGCISCATSMRMLRPCMRRWLSGSRGLGMRPWTFLSGLSFTDLLYCR